MNLPAYPRYKPNDVEWLGDVPRHWEIVRLRNIVVGGVTNGLFKTQDAFGDGTRLINVYDAYRSDFNVDEQSLERVATTPTELRLYRVESGDIFFVRSSLKLEGVGRAVCCLNPTEDLVFECHLVRARPDLRRINPRFLIFYLNSQFVVHSLIAAAKTTTMATISQPKMLDLPVLLPALPEQRVIAAFLDRETARLDRLVGKKRELIERLKEKRTTLISRTVTRGLPPSAARAVGLYENPSLKPSGLDWLGNIPAHWEVKRLKFIFPRLFSGVSVNSDNAPTVDDSPAILKTSCVYGNKFQPEENKRVLEMELDRVVCPATRDSLIISRMNTPELVGNCGYVERDYLNLFLPDRLWIARFANHPKAEGKFAWYLVISHAIRALTESLATGTSDSMKNLTQEAFLNISVGVPPLPEQNAIATFLDKETANLDALVLRVEEAVERLQEYRTALITAAVTGKVDVRSGRRD